MQSSGQRHLLCGSPLTFPLDGRFKLQHSYYSASSLRRLSMSHTIELTLDGLSCGHCVKRVKESLEKRPDVEHAEVTIERAEVTGSASADALIATVQEAGYGASVSHPKAKPLAESSLPSEALTAATSELPAADDVDDSQQLLINGMSCASCVSRVQKALQAVPGVTQARVNWRSALRWSWAVRPQQR
ncbi:hypothetical protein CWS02_20235 [Enterobacter sp. EA-1]|nr:hypothetical protein CWS02_20235 [Enterobacter sp. EA-1]